MIDIDKLLELEAKASSNPWLKSIRPFLLEMKALREVEKAARIEAEYTGDDAEQGFINRCKVLDALKNLDEARKG
jgi:hypothetical protein